MTPSKVSRRASAEAQADAKIKAALADGRIVKASKKRWRDLILPAGKTELVKANVDALESLVAFGPEAAARWAGRTAQPTAEQATHDAIMASAFSVVPGADRDRQADPVVNARVGELGLEETSADDAEFLASFHSRMMGLGAA